MNKIILALGYFDSIHIGHRKIIEKTVALSKKYGVKPALFSFDGDLAKFLGKPSGQVFTKTEKETILNKLGIDLIVYAPISKEYLSMSKTEFLQQLNDKYDIVGYVCGDDFTFGAKAQGNTNDLTDYSITHNQFLEVISEVSYDKKRVSTTRIKDLLSLGDIKSVNQLLGDDYFISGKVISGRGDGTKIGLPTANLSINAEKYKIKLGVYGGYVYIDGIKYKTVINYGNAPTFDFDKTVLEAFIVDFNGDLYGKEITLYFTDYLRDIIKFSSIDELVIQIEKDIEKL